MGNQNQPEGPSRKTWARRPGETPKAYAAFTAFLRLGPGRTYRQLAKHLGRKPIYKQTIERWASPHNWQDRAAAYDEYTLTRAADLRPHIRQAVIKRLQDRALGAADEIAAISAGKLKGGDAVPVLDRHGGLLKHTLPDGTELTYERPTVKASTRLQAAIRIHESVGVIPPKRVEHTGRDGEEIRHAHKVAVGLSDGALGAVASALGLSSGHVEPTIEAESEIGPSYQEDNAEAETPDDGVDS